MTNELQDIFICEGCKKVIKNCTCEEDNTLGYTEEDFK